MGKLAQDLLNTDWSCFTMKQLQLRRKLLQALRLSMPPKRQGRIPRRRLRQLQVLPCQKRAHPNVRRNPLLSVPDWRGFSPNVWIVWFSQDKLQHSIHFQPAIKKDFPTPHVHAGARIRCQMLILRGPKCSTFKHQAAVHSASIHCPFSVHSDRKSSIQPETALEIVTF